MHRQDIDNALDSLLNGGRPYLLLSDRNEKGYSSNSMNWEHFNLSAVIISDYITMLSNTRGHHVSPLNDKRGTSFIYLLSQKIWITQSDASGYEVVGGTNMYSDVNLKFKKNCACKIDIHGKNALSTNETKRLISYIKEGCFFFVTCELDCGTTLQLMVDLPMINEEGEYIMNIKPFIGMPGAILNPSILQAKMNFLCTAFEEQSPPWVPSLEASKEEVEETITKARHNMPSVSISFNQPAFERYSRPSLICVKLKEANQVIEISSSYLNEQAWSQTVNIQKCVLQVCE